MTDIKFGRLSDLPLRDAWPNEARQFTPWLAENIDQLSEVIGVPLVLTGTEVAVESFSADILARNPMDDSVVLIENQLEQTDHKHLGQIMTYLAGLEAQTVVWIAPSFREPHLSAIRWLNEHTADGFSFFAVKVRVVQIGDSPYAPIFETVEKPNDWNRTVSVMTKSAKPGSDDRNDRRLAFWRAYLDRVPSSSDWGLRPMRLPSMWVPIWGLGEEAYLSLWIGKDQCGVFLRGPRGSDGQSLINKLLPYAQELESKLGATFEGSEGGLLWQRAKWNYNDPDQWIDAIDWMEARREAYQAALSNLSIDGEMSY